jgi:hypothetical protein
MHGLQRTPPEPAEGATAVEADRRLWLGLVSKFLETGDTLAEAMVAALRIVAFDDGRPLAAHDHETRRTGSGTFPKTSRHAQTSSRVGAGGGRRK